MPIPLLSIPLAALQVGRPRTLGEPGAANPLHRAWTTALLKAPMTEPQWLSELNIDGDEQADLQNHGGPDQALCVYPGVHYAHWSAQLGQPIGAGSFGENLTLAGPWAEKDVCIGDIFRLGEATVQVSQPRSPCWKIARRWQAPLLPQWLQDTGFTGWYMRVLTPGRIQPNRSLELLERPFPEWTVARANGAKYEHRHDRALVAELAACPALGQRWLHKM